MLTHETDLLKQKPYLCCKSLKTGLCCMRRFGDPSSLSRHSREQHKGATYQCPFPGCLDRAKNPKRIKRQSEFKKHLVDKHNLTMEELALFQVFETDNIDEPAAGPSKPRKTTRKARRQRVRLPSPPPMYREAVSPAAHSSESPAPPSYSAVPYAGEIPTICTSNEDGYASTPGLTFCSPSPAPSIGEAAYDIHSKPAIPPPYYPSFESCPDFGAQPYPQPYPQDKDMSTYVAEASAGMGLLLPDSDLNNMSYASGLNHISVDSLSNMPQLFDQNSFMSDKPGPAQPPYADTTNSYYSGAPFDIAYQLSEYEYSGEYSSEYDQWAMPVPELAAPYVDQTNATIPPPFLHYGSSPFDVYNTQ
ncbi:hypothetical protein C8Q70DRAFT_972465 [Cubamyces menziesii]|nr:hypothetical protein C8Q70DRAFT_972465 [Cubamyces menziesii]